MNIRQALLLGLVAAVVLASAAGAGHDVARQRVAITFEGFAVPTPPASAKFVLELLTTGALRNDSGTSSIDFSYKPDVMRDGQTVQRSVATDPLSGRVVKVDVTLAVVK